MNHQDPCRLNSPHNDPNLLLPRLYKAGARSSFLFCYSVPRTCIAIKYLAYRLLCLQRSAGSLQPPALVVYSPETLEQAARAINEGYFLHSPSELLHVLLIGYGFDLALPGVL
jgi:hypothetical protein